jgi:hypothetical protein
MLGMIVTYIGNGDEHDGTAKIYFGVDGSGNQIVASAGKAVNLTQAQINAARGFAVFVSGDQSASISLASESEFKGRLRQKTWTPV